MHRRAQPPLIMRVSRLVLPHRKQSGCRAGVGPARAAGHAAGRRADRAHGGHHAPGPQERRPLPAVQLQGPDRAPLGHPQGAGFSHMHLAPPPMPLGHPRGAGPLHMHLPQCMPLGHPQGADLLPLHLAPPPMPLGHPQGGAPLPLHLALPQCLWDIRKVPLPCLCTLHLPQCLWDIRKVPLPRLCTLHSLNASGTSPRCRSLASAPCTSPNACLWDICKVPVSRTCTLHSLSACLWDIRKVPLPCLCTLHSLRACLQPTL